MEDKQCETGLKAISDKMPSNLEESIKCIAEKQNFLHYEISTKKISTDGGSYMGVLYEIDIKGKTVDSDKEVNIFAKNIAENIDMPIYSIPGIFATEAWAYTELFALFTKLQNEANVPSNERLKTAYSFDECNPKSIILEHLGKREFKLYHRMEPVSIEYAIMCIKSLAKFHAMTFVIKENQPAYFKAKLITKKQPYNFSDEWYGFVKNMSNYSINCLEDSDKDKLKDIILRKANDYPKYMQDTSSICTLCHGDFKLNNIMAKEINGEIIEVIPIDFQILHYGCPVLDFIYFIFNGTDREFRKAHLGYLKDLYYDSMEAFLHLFGIEVEKVFPRTEFEKIYKEKLDFGLMINVFYGPFLFALEDDAPDVTTEDLAKIDFKVDDKFTERFRGIVADFVKWGYI